MSRATDEAVYATVCEIIQVPLRCDTSKEIAQNDQALGTARSGEAGRNNPKHRWYIFV
jgi:hypothetical protein